MPYERQVDETDDAYGQRLRRRAQVAADIGNQSELLAILTAMQDDLDIPQAGLTIPCETADEWLTVAFLQGVDPASWENRVSALLTDQRPKGFWKRIFDR